MNSVFTQTTPTIDFFCELTQKAYAPYTVDVSEVLLSSDGWTSLADLWEDLIHETGKDIFADVLHLIKWGTPFLKDSPLAYQKLVLAVCEALQSTSPAFYAWTSHYFFKCCIDGITEVHFDRNWYPHVSSAHYHFLTSLATLKIWRYAPGHITACNNAACYIARYQARIVKLLPQARHWHQDEWLDESNIHKEIVQVYNVDFRSNLPAYQVLHRLLDSSRTAPTKLESEDIRLLVNLNIGSPKLIPVIWPNTNADITIKLFLLAEKRAQHLFAGLTGEVICLGSCPLKDCTYAQLSNSWLFSFVRQQFYTDHISSRHVSKVKKALLNIELRSHQ